MGYPLGVALINLFRFQSSMENWLPFWNDMYFSVIPFAFCLQKLRKELEESQVKLAEAKAKVQSLESKSGWFERRLAETEVCCCTVINR